MDTMELKIQCNYCSQIYTVSNIKPKDFQSWSNGEGFIQDIMPYLSVSDRELLISRTCDNCWNTMYEPQSIKLDEKESKETKKSK
jgi:hypothetical protein